MALGVNIVSSFDSKGIRKAVTEFGKLEGAGNKATYGLRTLDSAATNGLRNIAKFGAVAAVGLGAIAYRFAKTAEDALVADRVLLQVTTSMGLFGSSTEVVVDRLTKLAGEQQLFLGIEEDVIKATQAKLMTFKNLAVTADQVGGALDRTTMAALDLAATGFGEATGNAVKLGKALQDPIKGLTALSRVGVTFTDQEKEKIKVLVKSGKLLEAQDLLLTAIETKVGGTAEASAKSSVKIGLAFGEIAESLGTLLLPYFESFSNLLNEKVVPYVRNLADAIGENGLGAGFKMLSTDLLKAAGNMGTFGNVVLGLTAAFVALRLISIAATISMNLFTIALLKNPIGIVIAVVIALVVALVALYARFEGVRNVINMIGVVLKTTFMNVIELVYNAFALLYNAAAQGINLFIKGANLFGANIPEIEMLGYKAFTIIGNSAGKAAGKVAQVTKSVQQLARESDLLTGNLVIKPPVPTGTGATVKTLAEQIKSYREAVLKAVDANKSLANATQGVKDAQTALGDATHKIELAQRGVTKASDDVTKAIDNVAKAQRSVTKASDDVTKAIDGVAKAQRSVTKASDDVAKSIDNVTKAKRSVTKASDDVAKAIDGVTRAQRSVTRASDDVTEAIDGVAKAQNDTENARNDYQRSIDDTAKAQNNLTKATKGTKKAQDAFDAAVKGYGANSKQGKKSQRDLTEAQRDAEKAGYDAEKSVFDLAEAEKELEAVRADSLSTPQMIREAEINLAEAKLALAESQIKQEDSQISVTEATTLYDQVLNGVKEDSIIYKDLLEELNEKKAKEAEAVIAVTYAHQQESEALAKIAESLTKEGEAVKGVEEARYALADAIIAEGEAVKGIEEARYALADAITAESEAVKSVEDAKFALADAIIAEGDAIKGVEDAKFALADAITAEGDAIKGVEDAKFALAEAERAVIKAKEDEAKASRDLATAQFEEAKSLLAIAEAQKEVNKQKVEAGKMVGGKAALTKVDATLQGVRGLVNTSLAMVGQTQGVRMMATGGIVTRPTAAIIGERGAEAVIPLNKMGRFGGGTAINISVNAGMGADGADIGQQIIDAIRKAERRSGKVFAAA